MPEYQLELAERHLRRIFTRAVGKSIPKILTELITNADDSYRRIADAAFQVGREPEIEDPAPITIVFTRNKKHFSVIDHAEGLTDKEMEDRFVMYGQESVDRARGYRTRSLFGKGLRDVLFTQRVGQVKSIKNGLFYNCQFRWKEVSGNQKPFVNIKAPCRVTPELRTALGIPGNGTRVEFQLAEGVHNPQTDKLIEHLNNFYMLRMINSDPHREVVLKVLDSRGQLAFDQQLNYRFPEIDIKDRFEDDLQIDAGNPIRIKGEIGLAEKELTQGEVGYVERQGGLLVLDEDNAVLDLCLFDFDQDPAARRISGTLNLIGAGAYIRSKLNQADPEEILTETRDGFDKNHPFFRLLRTQIHAHLEPIVKILRDYPEPKSKLSEQTKERHQKALEILNKIADELLGISGKAPVIPGHLKTPPPEGIAFVTSHISIQTGVSTPTALLINTILVHPNDLILVESDCPEITVTPRVINIEKEDRSSGLHIKILRVKSDIADIHGKILATWKEKKVELEVTTTAREIITPVNGLEFERDEYVTKIHSKRNLRLYVDVEKVLVGSEIKVIADSPAIHIDDHKVMVQTSQLITPQVAQIDIPVIGTELTKGTLVNASHQQYVAGTSVSVVKKEKQLQGMQGLFKNYEFRPLELKVQSWYDTEGVILINTKDPVNQRYFGTEPYKTLTENAHCQVRLADLILNECLQVMASIALNEGKLERRFPNNPETDIRSYVDNMKFEIGLQIHIWIVDKVS
ncbi:MAG: hypothetical protein NTU60_11570 [Candidatus Aminicenantes bacterium]|nr:hypothetical protein [Candidatus Aminicenantes bacterium]